VAAIVVLRPRGGSELEVRFAGGPDAVAEVYPSMTRLDATTWPDSFRCTAELVRRVPCHTARLPDDLGRAAQLGPRLIDAVTTRRPTA
jgi:hypothetical protein